MNDSLQRIRSGSIFLGIVLITSITVFHFAFDYDWVGAVWMTAVTLSSVGYAESPTGSHASQLFEVGLIVFGMSAVAYTVGGFIQLMTEGEIEKALGRKRMTNELRRLKDHVIVCGFGRIGQVLCEELKRHHRTFVVIEQNNELVEEARSRGLLTLQGDATEESVLKEVSVQSASTLVCGLPSDASNVFITLTCRNLNPGLHIIARADHQSSDRKLRQAGADRIVMPTLIGARQMSRMIVRPMTADLIELFSGHDVLDVELDEISVDSTSPLIGISVRQTEAHREHRLLVVAVKRSDGELVFNPNAQFVFSENDTVMLMGKSSDLREFLGKYDIHKE